jgi:hypothetical protein
LALPKLHQPLQTLHDGWQQAAGKSTVVTPNVRNTLLTSRSLLSPTNESAGPAHMQAPSHASGWIARTLHVLLQRQVPLVLVLLLDCVGKGAI